MASDTIDEACLPPFKYVEPEFFGAPGVNGSAAHETAAANGQAEVCGPSVQSLLEQTGIIVIILADEFAYAFQICPERQCPMNYPRLHEYVWIFDPGLIVKVIERYAPEPLHHVKCFRMPVSARKFGLVIEANCVDN